MRWRTDEKTIIKLRRAEVKIKISTCNDHDAHTTKNRMKVAILEIKDGGLFPTHMSSHLRK